MEDAEENKQEEVEEKEEPPKADNAKIEINEEEGKENLSGTPEEGETGNL